MLLIWAHLLSIFSPSLCWVFAASQDSANGKPPLLGEADRAIDVTSLGATALQSEKPAFPHERLGEQDLSYKRTSGL